MEAEAARAVFVGKFAELQFDTKLSKGGSNQC
jgi:hypothetical protein